jgi:hypothetical protein
MQGAINVGDIVRVCSTCPYYEGMYNGMLGYVVRVDLKTNARYVKIFECSVSNEIFFSFHHLEKVDSKYGLG